MTKSRKRAYAALILTAIIWGAALPIVKLALPHTTPFRWLFYRYLFAAPLSLPILIFYLSKTKPTLKQIFSIALLELLGTTLVLSVLYTGLNHTTALEASLIGATAPLFIVLGGVLFLREKEEKHEWFGLILALAGTLLITIGPLFTGNNSTTGFSLLGNGLILLQNILWASYLIIAKKVYKKVPKLLVTSISFWVGLTSFFVLSSITDPTPMLESLSTPIVLMSALYMATFGSIIALTLYMFGQNLIEASEATLFTYLQPVVAIPLSIILLKESITPTTIVAISILTAGVYLAEKRPHTSGKKS